MVVGVGVVPDRGLVDRPLGGLSARRRSLNSWPRTRQPSRSMAEVPHRAARSVFLADDRVAPLRDAGVLAGKKTGEPVGKLSEDQAEIAHLRAQQN